MTRLHLKYVQSFRGYHYFRRRGSPYIQLPGTPGSAEFMEAYQRALAAAPVTIGASKRSFPGSVSAAIADYYGSQAFRSLTGGTPAKRRAILERFREDYGHKRLATLPKDLIVALLDTMPPHSARNWLKTFRHFIRWCESRKLVHGDPTWGIRLRIPKSDGHHTWSEDEISAFEAVHPVGSKARLAAQSGNVECRTRAGPRPGGAAAANRQCLPPSPRPRRRKCLAPARHGQNHNHRSPVRRLGPGKRRMNVTTRPRRALSATVR
jgi:integrase/recombinase XerD